MIEIPKNYFDVAVFLLMAQPWLALYLTNTFGKRMSGAFSGFIGAMLLAICFYMMITGKQP